MGCLILSLGDIQENCCLRDFSSDSVCALLVHAADFHFSNMEPLISQLGHGIMHQRAMAITGNGSNQICSAPVRLPDHRHLGITSICVLRCYVVLISLKSIDCLTVLS